MDIYLDLLESTVFDLMNKTKTSLYIIILLICAALLFGFVYFSDGLFEIMKTEQKETALDEMVLELNEKDGAIFWIGNIPENLSQLDLNIIKVDRIDQTTLPFKMYSVTKSEVSEEGFMEYSTSLKEGYCPENSFIVICNANNSEDCITNNLTSEDYSLIIRSLNESNAKLYIFGTNEVKAFKEYSFLPTDNCFSFKTTRDTGNTSGIFDKLENKNVNSIAFITAFINDLLLEANS